MAEQSIGKVIVVYGTVKALSQDGVERVLQPNSPVFLMDEIITGPDGSISIVFNDAENTQLDLGRMTDMVVDTSILAAEELDLEDVTADIEAIQEALESGEEIDVEATAAGGAAAAGAGGGGRPIVKLSVDGKEGEITSGAETAGVTFNFTGSEQEIVVDPVEPVVVVPPPPPEPPAPDAPAPLAAAVPLAAPAPPPPPPEIPIIPPPPPPPPEPPELIVARVVEEEALGGEGDLSSGNQFESDGVTYDFDEFEDSGGAGDPQLNSDFITGNLNTESAGPSGAWSINLADAVEVATSLTSQGDPITYLVENNPGADGIAAIADIGGENRPVFILQINEDGTYGFQLFDQIDHPNDLGNDPYENPLLLDFTEYLQVEVSGTTFQLSDLGGSSFVINAVDDIPVANIDVDPIRATVEEDGMDEANDPEAGDGDENGYLDLSTGNREGAEDDFSDEAGSGISGTLEGLFSIGADEFSRQQGEEPGEEPAQTEYGFGIAPTATVQDELPQLWSQGEAVTYESDGHILTASAGGRVVFTLEVNDEGSWLFDLDDQLDHIPQGLYGGDESEENMGLRVGDDWTPGNPPPEELNVTNSVNYLDLSAVITLTDFDGDTVTGAAPGSFLIDLQDDVPVALVEPTTIQAFVEEDDMTGVAGGDLSTGNNEDGTTNADEDSSEDLLDPQPSVASLFSIGSDEDEVDPEVATVTYGVTQTQAVLDGLDDLELRSQGELVTFGSNGSVLTASAGGRDVMTFTVNDDGSWDVDLKDQFDHVDDGEDDENTELVNNTGESLSGIDLSSVLTATDFDGDTVTGAADGSFILTIEDDVPVALVEPTTIQAFVEEDDMTGVAGGDLSTGNNEDGTTNADEDSSEDLLDPQPSVASLFSIGSDEDEVDPEVATVTYGVTQTQAVLDGLDDLELRSQGELVTFGSNGSVLTASAGGRDVMTFTVNDDGSWDVDLKDQFDHVDDGEDDENTELVNNTGESLSGIDLSSVLTATDFDGDTVTGAADGSFILTIEDDVPVALVEPTTIQAFVEEDDMTGVAGGDLSTGNNEDGTTNADEDSSEDLLDPQPSVASLFSIGSDEDEVDPEVATVTYGVTQTQAVLDGLDDLELRSQGELVTFDSNGSVLTASAGGRDVMTFTVNDDGSWDVDLKDQFDHVDDGEDDENTELVNNTGESLSGIDLSSVLTATDFDGDTVTGAADGSFILTIEDDVPVALVEPTTIQAFVEEDDMTGVAGGDLSTGNNEDGTTNADEDSSADLLDPQPSVASLFSIGSDEDEVDPEVATVTYGVTQTQAVLDGLDDLELRSQGELVTFDSNGSVLTASAGGRDVMTFTVNDDGSWDVDLKDQFDHVDDGNNDENTELVNNTGESLSGIDLSSVLTATDFDGDTVTGAADGSFILTIEDDIPEVGTPQDALLANETGNSVTGSLNIIGSGADEPASISLGLTDGQQIFAIQPEGQPPQGFTSGGEALYWQDNGDGSWSAVTTGDGSIVAFTISVDEANGTYTVFQDSGVDGASSSQTIDFSDALNGGNTYEAVFGPDDATVVTNGTTTTYSDSVFVWARAAADQLSPFALPVDTETVNYSNSGVGVGAGSMIDGDGSEDAATRESDILSIKFYSEIEVDESGNSQGSVRVNESNSTVLQLSGVTLILDHLGSAESAYYTLWNGGVQVSDEYSISGLDGGTGSSADQKDDPLEIDVINGPQVLTSGTTFDEVRLEAGVNDAYRIESAEITVFNEGFDETLLIPVEITDADGDTVLTDFSVTFDGNGDIDATVADAADGDVSTSGMAISGSSEDDVIIGTNYDDTIDGGEGSDTIYGDAGDTLLTQEIGNNPEPDGNDFITGGDGDDTIYGDNPDEPTVGGDDTLIGGDGIDELYGGAGDDILVGDAVDFGTAGVDDTDIIEDEDADVVVGGDDSSGGSGTDQDIAIDAAEAPADAGNEDVISEADPVDEGLPTEDPLLLLIPPDEAA